MVSTILSALVKLIGLRESRRSLVGKHAQKLVKPPLARRLLSIGIVGLVSSVVMIRNMANIGGPLAVNAEALTDTPTVSIDTSTISSVQKPIDYQYESRGYSWFHSGADLVAPIGTQIRPIMEGTVSSVTADGWGWGFGKHIIISHGEGYESLYAHLSEVEVETGQKVSLGGEIGKSGNTGLSTGPHLHLEVRQNGSLVNPAEIVPGVN